MSPSLLSPTTLAKTTDIPYENPPSVETLRALLSGITKHVISPSFGS